MGSKLAAYFDLAAAMVIVGSSVVFGKIIVAAFPVFLASGLRFALAVAVLIPLVLKTEGALPSLPGRDWLTLTIMAFCGQVVFTVLLLYGLTLTSAMEAGLITSTTPAAMAIMAFIFLSERMTPRQAAGVLLAVIGVATVNGVLGKSTDVQNGHHWLGNLLVCGAVMGEAVFLLFRKRITTPISDLVLSAYLCLLGLGMFLPLAAYQALDFDFAAPGLLGWGAILYFGLVFTAVAYLFWFHGVARVSGSTAGVFTSLMPISALTLSYIFLSEPITAANLIGGACILSAIGLMTISRS
jgi:drug/metabolite transporter (DMT)-like permease